jgi:hypothetical protein
MSSPPTLKRAAADADDGDYAPAPPVKKPRVSAAKKPRARAVVAASAPGKCGMSKKELGDHIQAGLKCVRCRAGRAAAG